MAFEKTAREKVMECLEDHSAVIGKMDPSLATSLLEKDRNARPVDTQLVPTPEELDGMFGR
jgi:hypothetical protein